MASLQLVVPGYSEEKPKEWKGLKTVPFPTVFGVDLSVSSGTSYWIYAGHDPNISNVVVFITANKSVGSKKSLNKNSDLDLSGDDCRLKAAVFSRFGVHEMTFASSTSDPSTSSQNILTDFLTMYRTPFDSALSPDLKYIKPNENEENMSVKEIASLLNTLVEKWLPHRHLVSITSGNTNMGIFNITSNPLSPAFEGLAELLGEQDSSRNFNFGSFKIEKGKEGFYDSIYREHQLIYGVTSKIKKKILDDFFPKCEIMIILFEQTENDSTFYLGNIINDEDDPKIFIIVTFVKDNYHVNVVCRRGIPSFPPASSFEFATLNDLALFLKLKCIHASRAIYAESQTFLKRSHATLLSLERILEAHYPKQNQSRNIADFANSLLNPVIPSRPRSISDGNDTSQTSLGRPVSASPSLHPATALPLDRVSSTSIIPTSNGLSYSPSATSQSEPNSPKVPLKISCTNDGIHKIRQANLINRPSFLRKMEDLWTNAIDNNSEEYLTLTPKEKQRQEIIYEIIKTENSYVADLQTMSDVFVDQLSVKNIVPRSFITSVFGNLLTLKEVNETFLLDLLKRQADNKFIVKNVGDIFLKHVMLFKLYITFVGGQHDSKKQVEHETNTNADFKNYLAEALNDPRCRRLNLQTFMIAPMQRLTRYPLLLREVLKKTDETHEDYQNCVEAMNAVEDVLKQTNARKRKVEDIKQLSEIAKRINWNGFQEISIPSLDRRVLLEGELQYFKDVKAKISSGKSWKRTGTKTQAILFTDFLLLATVTVKNKLSLICPPIFVNMILIRDFSLAGDFHLFEIVHVGSDIHFLSAKTLEEKNKWLKLIQQEAKFSLEKDTEKETRFKSRGSSKYNSLRPPSSSSYNSQTLRRNKERKSSDPCANPVSTVHSSQSLTRSLTSRNKLRQRTKSTSHLTSVNTGSLPNSPVLKKSKSSSAENLYELTEIPSQKTLEAAETKPSSSSNDLSEDELESEELCYHSEENISEEEEGLEEEEVDGDDEGDILEETMIEYDDDVMEEDSDYEKAIDDSVPLRQVGKQKSADFRMDYNIPHQFKAHSQIKPITCQHCEKTINREKTGLNRRVLKCTVCGLSVHSKCTSFVPPLCGISKGLAITLQGLSSATTKKEEE